MTLMLRGQTRSNQCFGTSASATTLLLRGQTRSDQCFGTPANATTLLLYGKTRFVQYCIVPLSTYCTVFLSFIVTGLCRHILICCIPE